MAQWRSHCPTFRLLAPVRPRPSPPSFATIFLPSECSYRPHGDGLVQLDFPALRVPLRARLSPQAYGWGPPSDRAEIRRSLRRAV
jgi:hypothetical protein